MGSCDIIMAAACEIYVVLVADASVLNKGKVHTRAAEWRLKLFSDVLSVDGETYASYLRGKSITLCIVEALTPELMRHKMESLDHDSKIFGSASGKLPVFLAVEISETATVTAAGEFDTELVCLVDAGIRDNAPTTRAIAAAIDSLIMNDMPINVANESGDIVQVAEHVLTLVLKDVPVKMLDDDHFVVMTDFVTRIIKAARAIGSDNKQG